MKKVALIMVSAMMIATSFYSCDEKSKKGNSEPLDDDCDLITISEGQANEYFKNYINSTQVVNAGEFRGILLDKKSLKCIDKAIKTPKPPE